MKSLADLMKIRDEAKKKINLRTNEDEEDRVVVGLATCGIAAGARPVLNQFVKDVNELGLNVKVTQTGCMGACTYEPMVEVIDRDGTKTTYVYMNKQKASEVVRRHLKDHEVVEEYTIGHEK